MMILIHRVEKITELEGLKALVVDDDFNTSVEGVFAAGDISKAKADKTACYATALGKKVAQSIDKYMQNIAVSENV